MYNQINQCQEGTNISGQIVSHFYKFDEQRCICVFCGKQVQLNSFNLVENSFYSQNQQNSTVGQRS